MAVEGIDSSYYPPAQPPAQPAPEAPPPQNAPETTPSEPGRSRPPEVENLERSVDIFV